MKKSDLEICFDLNFKKPLQKAGFKYETQKTIPGERFEYDVRLTRGETKILIELDGNGMGHTSVKSRERDARKGNHAVMSGYLFFRLTGKHFRTVKGVRVPENYAHELIADIIRLPGTTISSIRVNPKTHW